MHWKDLSLGIAAIVLTTGSPVSASAMPAFIPAGDVADAPSGFTDMCQADGPACGMAATPAGGARVRGPALGQYFTSAAVATAPMTDAAGWSTRDEPRVQPDDSDKALIRIARRINDSVNSRTIQRSDIQTYGVDELWRPAGKNPGAVGDCEDLALEKRAELLAAGVPAARLMLATVFRSGIGLHTVLVLRRLDGDFVLDSRTNRILPWMEARYSWLRVQSGANPLEWRRVRSA